MALTLKQEMFVKEFLVDLNGTQAAIRAGYSAKRADAIAYENLRKPDIAEAIKQHMDSRSKKVEITAEDVLESILRIRGKAEQAERYNDALKANELLGKHLKLFTDKTELTGADGGAIIHKIERVVIKPTNGDTPH